MTDPWGDHALREHLRPFGREPFFAEETEQPIEDADEPEQVDPAELVDVAESVRQALYGNETAEETPAEEDTELEDPERGAPQPASISGKVFTVFTTFPRERLRGREIAETLGLETKQVYSAIEHLRRLRQPVFAESPGVYYYDPSKPVDETVLKKSSWYKNYRPGVKPSKPRKAVSQPSRENLTPNLLLRMPLHDRGVMMYEAMLRLYPDNDTSRSLQIPARDVLNDEERKLFPTESVIKTTMKYLHLIGSVEKAGPNKFLHYHPDAAPTDKKAAAEQEILSSFALLKDVVENVQPTSAAGLTRAAELVQALPAPVSEPVAPQAPAGSVEELIEQVDEDRLAQALAGGMWNRYEWALTELGRLNEQLLGLQEALRGRDEEINRLRGYLAQHQPDIKDIAREILTPDTGRG